ncbi:hypothetical protein M2132_000062 [Dysgonomonas sp. PH5-45]|uniref:type IX secretion system anionic LPS delivery protein PorZ n=1 Tax=unclassified Dysgonomonas TaxID=2630389 RepID=UPI002476EFE4|nr:MULTISPECIES: hypothetical protein [unclassified Dysgonomonas]MDH6353745.1 hypothetical protein [Dysgonomonas sp. PH5-45]MDH6386648.1 hypothetical protein [Dysgonomonas sp. PH5-37]
MKKILSVLFLLFTSLSSSCFGQAIGQWETLFSYETAPATVCATTEKVYTLTDGKLFSCSTDETDNLVEIYVKKDGGNQNIKQIAYDKTNKLLLIFRENADIDLMDDNGYMYNIPYLKNSTQNIDKALNGIYFDGDYAYLSMNFGLLVIDMLKAEIKASCIFQFKVYDSYIHDNKLYICSEGGVKYVDPSINIQDINNWSTITISDKYHYSDYTFIDSELRGICVYKGCLHFYIPTKAIYYLNGDNVERFAAGWWPVGIIPHGEDGLLGYNDQSLWIFTGLGEIRSARIPGLTSLSPSTANSTQYWVGTKNENLSLIEVDPSGNVNSLRTELRPNGPLSNVAFSMYHDNEKLLLVGGGYSGDRMGHEAQLSQLGDNNIWFNYDKSLIDSKIPSDLGGARDFSRVTSNPSNPGHIFVESFGEGVYEFRDKEFVSLHRSPLFEGVVTIDEASRKNYIRFGGMSYDRRGNLWFLGTQVANPITVLTKEGTWHKLGYGSIAEKNTVGRNVMVDRYNRKWMSTYSRNPFLFILDDNNTVSNLNDDKTLFQDHFSDQDGGTVNITSFNDMKEDLNGTIWAATDVGPFLIYNQSNIFSKKELTLYKIKIPRNDGTNNADILLGNVSVSAIAIDGANRKWLGTDDSGIFLVSEDGMETIHNFTTKNSPMPSDKVYSIAINPNTGLVYIGTDKGLVAYKSDATTGRSDYSDVYAYPNPVRPDYDGPIVVTGLQANSNVKITDIKGNLINQGKSLGGQYVWDGRNAKGNKVDIGTYLVMGSSEDGKNGVVTKILVVK